MTLQTSVGVVATYITVTGKVQGIGSSPTMALTGQTVVTNIAGSFLRFAKTK